MIIEVPHLASLRGKEREICILRSDNGQVWQEHTMEASDDAVHDALDGSFEGTEWLKPFGYLDLVLKRFKI